MPPTVCISDGIDDNRVSFSVQEHLLNLKATHRIGEGVTSIRFRRRPKRLLRLKNFQITTCQMGLVVNECQQSLSFQEDSPGLPCDSDSNSSDTSNWPKNYHLQMIRRREGLLDITVRTIALIRRNQQLQLRLSALQEETRAFVQSVLKNPENQQKPEDLNNDEEETAVIK